MKISFEICCCFLLPVIVNSLCNSKKYNSDSIVCICNQQNCDTIPKLQPLPKSQYVKYTSSRRGLRFHKRVGTFKRNGYSTIGFEIFPNIQFKEILGFGGTFTDSAGFNIKLLSPQMQDTLMKSLFSTDGIEYTMGRVPMAATDYSIGPYTYADVVGDVKLKYFELKFEDFFYKLPLIRKAMELSNNQLQLIASPWTAPPWMKTNNRYAFIGQLKKEHYQNFADYYIKFLEAYENNGVPIWGVTTGNEPIDGFIGLPLPSMGWTINNAIKWVAENLGPTLKNSRYNNTKLLIHDDQKLFLPRIQKFFRVEEALKYIDGVAFHWYLNFLTPPNYLNYAKTPKKDLILMATEASSGWLIDNVNKIFLGFFRARAVILGHWGRAEEYINDIINDLEFDGNGWIDWNLALDALGGPVYTNFRNDACIIINATSDEFYKQPMYYAIGHFSKFIPRYSVRIGSNYETSNRSSIRLISFHRPDNGIVVIIYNNGYADEVVDIRDKRRGIITTIIEKKSINTIVYW